MTRPAGVGSGGLQHLTGRVGSGRVGPGRIGSGGLQNIMPRVRVVYHLFEKMVDTHY